MPNPARPANPFTPSDEPDWVNVGSIPSSSNVTRSSSTASKVSRRLPPPFEGNGSPQLPPRRSTTNEEVTPPSRPNISPSPSLRSISSAASAAAQRKPAPPIKPKKPSLLSNPISPTMTADGAADQQFNIAAKASTPPAVPPARRSMAIRQSSAAASQSRSEDDDAPPPLPSRTGTGLSGKSHGGNALMDDTDEQSMNGLSGWKVLKPA